MTQPRTNQPDPSRSDLGTRSLDSPVGVLKIVASADGVRAVLWPDDDLTRVPSAAFAPVSMTALPATVERILEDAHTQLEEYFAGERLDFAVSLDAVGTDFQHAAWTALRAIPFGETVSYGEQAARLGDRNKARAVGAANGKNPISIIVPCHRVVGSNGSLTGFAGGVGTKQWLLAHEQRVSGNTLL